MNDLQMMLLLVGVGGIAAMLAYNGWQDYRLRKQARERFGQTDQDPLLNVAGARTEPGFNQDDADESEYFPEEMDEALVYSETDEALNNPVQENPDRRLFADFIIRFEESKGANVWKSLVDGLDHINRKKIIYSVCTSNQDEEPDVWFQPFPFEGKANTLKASVQIANRKGPLTSLEFSELLGKFRRFSESHNAELEFPDMKEVISKAETLDQAAAALDTLLGLHCMVPDEVEESTSIDMLTASGWTVRGHQWFMEGDSGTLASMVIHKAPGKRLLSFSIDVPNSADSVKALGDVVTLCHSMNEQFGALMMDDSGRTLTTDGIQGIYEQLIERVKNLTDSGFAPGSPASRTLFS